MQFAELPLVATPISVVDENLVKEGIQRCSAGLKLSDISLIRQSMNGVYRATAPDGPVIMRVSRPTGTTLPAIEFAHYLQNFGFEVPAPISHTPFRHDEIEITLWEFIEPDFEEPVNWQTIGTFVRHLHDIDPETIATFYPLPKATSFPWWNFDQLLEELRPTFVHDDHAILSERWQSLRPYLTDAHNCDVDLSTSHATLCHGDIHPGNVIVNRSTGRPVLLDWDLLSVAPREWDHAALLTWSSRWGGDATTYPEFALGYESDFSSNDLATALAELRLLSATLMRWRAGLISEPARAEAENRMKWWRQDPSAPMWQAV
jgi:Ser/Thr protein kinase RdoA (MazF antagonist)